MVIYYDTETCGLHGPAVLIQYAIDDGSVILHSVWHEPILETIKLIEMMMNHEEGVVGFNLAFDHFHLCQLYTTLILMSDYDAYPIDCINKYAELEPIARDGPCLKPSKACDLMLHARKGPYQSTMDRKDIIIRRVPTQIAWEVAKELEKRIPLKDIYFARKKNKNAPKWQVMDIKNGDPNFKNIVLKFASSSALKALAADIFNLKADDVLLFADIEPQIWPVELGYAPFALAIGDKNNWKGAWPECIRHHASHWTYNQLARQYAEKDVIYTRDIYKYFGSPKLGDDDSELACMVGACRWKGYQIDVDALTKLKEKAQEKAKAAPTAPRQAKYFISELLDETERLVLAESTKKTVLEELSTLQKECPKCICVPNEDCEICKGTGVIKHPAAERAKMVLEARQAQYEEDLYNKLLHAGRFHASFIVIGTLSSRMAGGGSGRGIEMGGKGKGDKLNPQGIKHTKEVRSCFPLASKGMVLCLGDFDAFEVTLADAAFNDLTLREELKSGKKIHALFAMDLFPDKTYEQIIKSKGSADDMYDKGKRGVFAIIYGGNEETLRIRIGIPIEEGKKAFDRFIHRHPRIGIERQKIFDKFASMRQPGGIGTQVEWYEPAEYIESLFGFRRYFTLENQICRALWEMANKPPQHWKNIKIKVFRRDREQTVSGAVQSALYGAAFQLQSAAKRAANNHLIQASGAQVTKRVQRKIWDLQLRGINKWIVQPMNVHDEVLCPTDPNYVKQVHQVVDETVESFRPKVPLIKMEWTEKANNWADK